MTIVYQHSTCLVQHLSLTIMRLHPTRIFHSTGMTQPFPQCPIQNAVPPVSHSCDRALCVQKTLTASGFLFSRWFLFVAPSLGTPAPLDRQVKDKPSLPRRICEGDGLGPALGKASDVPEPRERIYSNLRSKKIRFPSFSDPLEPPNPQMSPSQIPEIRSKFFI